MSWATPVRSHVVVTMMARSITVERSVPALLELARVSGLGTWVFILYQGFTVDLQEYIYQLTIGGRQVSSLHVGERAGAACTVAMALRGSSFPRPPCKARDTHA